MKRLVLAGGIFDVIHIGHINYFKKAKSLGDTLAVHITEGKSFFNAKKRAAAISAIKFVDFVFIAPGDFCDKNILKKLKPDILMLNDGPDKFDCKGTVVFRKYF